MSLLWENLLRPIITYCHLKSHTGNGPILGLCTWEFIKERAPVTIVQFQKSSAIALPLVYTEKATTGIFKRQKQGRKKKRSRCNRKRNVFMTSFFPDKLVTIYCLFFVVVIIVVIIAVFLKKTNKQTNRSLCSSSHTTGWATEQCESSAAVCWVSTRGH